MTEERTKELQNISMSAIKDWIAWQDQMHCDDFFHKLGIPRPENWGNGPTQSPIQRKSFVWNLDAVRKAFEEMRNKKK